VTSVVGLKVARRPDAVQVAALLDSPEIGQLVAELAATRWTGRPGYPLRMMVGMALAKSIYALPTWTRTVALVSEHAALRSALGCTDPASVPSVHACYRFAAKLRAFKPLLDACLDRVTAALHEQLPDLGSTVAIDASDMPAYANGQRYLYKGGPERKTYSDPDATWGHRSAVSTRAAGSFYGYKLHQAVDAGTGLPLAWRVETAKAQESSFAVPLLDALTARGFRPEVAVLDMGYDLTPVYEGFEERGCHPIIPLRETPAVKAGKHCPPVCEHGEWTFAGSDAKRQAAKWRCPTGECTPASCWIKADRLHTLIPRTSLRWKKLYRQRGAVEREFGRLKNEWALSPLRVRRIERVALHADLTILARLACALTKARAVPLGA
jgi:transposase, IS5 family